MRSCVLSARISSVRGWNGANAATSSVLGRAPFSSGACTRWGKSNWRASAKRTSSSVTRSRRTAASPKRTPSSAALSSTRSTSAGVSLPCSTRIAPMGRSARTSARGGSNEMTFSFELMRGSPSRGAGKRAGIVRPGQRGWVPRPQRPEQRRLDAQLDVGGRGDGGMDELEEENRGEPEQHADEGAKHEIERHARPQRAARLGCRVENGDVGLLGAALDLVHEVALQRRLIGFLRDVGVPDQHRRLAPGVAQGLDLLPLRLEVALERRLARGVLRARARDAADHLVHLAPDALAQRLHFRRLLLVLRAVGPGAGCELRELRFGAQQVALQPLNQRIRDHLGHAFRGGAPARLAEARRRVVARGGSLQRLVGELIQARGLDVEALVRGEDAPLALEGPEPRLRLLELLAQSLQLLVEPRRRLPRRLDAQLQRRVDVGLGEGVGALRRARRIPGAEAPL